MKVTEDKTTEYHSYTRSIVIEGLPAEEYKGYTHKGKLWVPDFAVAVWNHGEPITTIKVTGPILKKDGTPSESQRGEKRYATPLTHRSTRWSTPAPAWLLELFGIEVPA